MLNHLLFWQILNYFLISQFYQFFRLNIYTFLILNNIFSLFISNINNFRLVVWWNYCMILNNLFLNWFSRWFSRFLFYLLFDKISLSLTIFDWRCPFLYYFNILNFRIILSDLLHDLNFYFLMVTNIWNNLNLWNWFYLFYHGCWFLFNYYWSYCL